jgi:aldose 1-epimerase
MPASSPSPRLSRAPFGALPDGGTVEAITLRNAAGMEAVVLTLGATLQAVHVPDRDGRFTDVTTGFSSIEAYLARHPYFGSTVGRVANRIAGGRFSLDGRDYALPVNNGPNSLHGGADGFDRVNWRVVSVAKGPDPSVTLAMDSPDGDQGYPGKLAVQSLWRLREDNSLTVTYTATCDAPTIVNITNHAYWNLAGEGSGSAMDQQLMIAADAYLPTDATAIPTGERRPVADTPFDFRKAAAIGSRIRDARDAQILIGRGYDHNWIVGDGMTQGPRTIARLSDPASGRTMELRSNQPGLQFYSGNFLDGSLVGKAGRAYRMGDAVALEPQAFPDTPNQPDFGSIRLDPGQTYCHMIEWQFSVEGDD